MNSERILLALLLVVAVLAAVPQIAIPMVGLILVVLGLIGGALGNYSNATDRIVIYVAVLAIPAFAVSLDAFTAIPVVGVVGPWVHQVLTNVTTGIQGMAVSIFVLTIYRRVMPR